MSRKSTLTWLQLSDSHIGNPFHNWDSTGIFRSLVKDLKVMQNGYGLIPDLMFFTGDLVFGAYDDQIEMEQQFDEFNKFIDQIRDAINPSIKKDCVFIVPGNHDVNRRKVGDDQVEWIRARKSAAEISNFVDNSSLQFERYLERLDNYRTFIEVYDYNHYYNDKTLNYTKILNLGTLKVSVTGLNTVWASSEDGERGKLWLGLPQLTEAININQDEKPDVKIILAHHPPNWLCEEEEKQVKRYIDRNFDFFLHGHEHDDWVERGDNCIKISAGCCYEKPQKKTGYNIVRTIMNDCRAEVFLRTYDNKGGRWIPQQIYGKTSTRGVWPFTNLPFDIRKKEQEQILQDTVDVSKRKRIDIFKYFTVSKAQDDEDLFVGRRDELCECVGALMSKGTSIIIYGKAGVGKSSLAIQLGYIAVGKHQNLAKETDVPTNTFKFPVIYYCCKKEVDIDILDLFTSILLDSTLPFSIWDLITKRDIRNKLSQQKFLLIKSQLDTLIAEGRTEKTKSFSVNLFMNLASLISESYDGLQVVLIIDEFDRIKEKSGLSSYIKAYEFIKIVMSGTSIDIRLLVEEHESIPRQIAEGQIMLNPMIHKECSEILIKESRKSNGMFEFTNEAIVELSKSSRGMPFFIHFFGRYSLDEAQKRCGSGFKKPLRIEKKDVMSAIINKINNLSYLDAIYYNLVKDDWRKEIILKVMSFMKHDEFDTRVISSTANSMDISLQMCTSVYKLLLRNNNIIQTRENHYEFIDNRLKVFTILRSPINIKAKNIINKFIENDNGKNNSEWILPDLYL